ncbi:MAG: PRC-barrel domain-containing protein [Anaerolineae bacterium]|nr:PRC-barrel domain-containing protein [Anaerolineae bacterium]
MMFRSLKEINGYTIVDLSNEAVGSVNDFYFDDVAWVIRYLVVDIGVWLPGRKVLISPVSLGQPDWGGGVSLPVRLTKQQIEASPPLDADQPVSRQEEIELVDFYQWPTYWNDVTIFDARTAGMDPESYLASKKQAAQTKAGPDTAVIEKAATAEYSGDPHLRSVDEVSGYYIQATDSDIGHVEDFIIDTTTWTIRYMVIDTKNWWPGKKVLVSPLWVDQIDWGNSKVHVGMNRQMIKNSPEFDPSTPINRAYEERLFDYYGRPRYW